jgi:hypothetical protein
MKMTTNRLVIGIATLSIGIVISACAAETNTLTPQARADFEWFSTLGLPDLKGCPYVRVATGGWNTGGDQPPQQNFRYGFLLSTNATGFTLYNSYMMEETFLQPSPATVKPTNQLGLSTRPQFEVVGLSNGVNELLEIYRDSQVWKEKSQMFGSLAYDAGDVFTMAWACWRNGLGAQAQQLYDQAGKWGFRWGQDVTTTNFSLALEKDLGAVMYDRAVGNFDNAAISRPQLLAQFESVASNYPHSPYLERAKQYAAALKRMISEDEAHAKIAPANLDALPVEQKVSELIFRLREQNGGQWWFPGSFDIFGEMRRGTNTPAHQLLRLGYAAVPQLIAALDNPAFCRMVDTEQLRFVSTNLPAQTVLTVGDCAETILERIAGKTFYQPRKAASHFSKEGDLPLTRKVIETWWAVAEKKGEKQVLIEEIASPNPNLGLVPNLIQRFPEIAAATIIRGALAATNSDTRYRLVFDVAKLDDPQVTEFLSQDEVSAPSLLERVNAAYGLRDRRKEEAVQAMIHLWDDPLRQSNDDGSGLLEGFLADSDSVPAIEALGRGLRQRPASTRWRVIVCVGGQTRTPVGGANRPSPATLNAIEDFLVAALDDTEDTMKYIPAEQRWEHHPRTCDMAGGYLSERWPDRYVFDSSLGLNSRERQRVECQNVWRLARNLPALPLPQPPNRVKPEQANTVTAIEWAADSAKPEAVFAARVEAFRDKLLDTNTLVPFLAALATHPEPQFSGLVFKANKDEDLTGVRFKISLLAGTPPAEGKEWDFASGVILNRKNLEGRGGQDLVGKYSTAATDGFPEAVAKALAAAPETPYEINFRLAPQNSQ